MVRNLCIAAFCSIVVLSLGLWWTIDRTSAGRRDGLGHRKETIFARRLRGRLDLFNYRMWACRSFGLSAVAAAVTLWAFAPVRDVVAGQWMPPDYATTILMGLGFWNLGIRLLSTSGEPTR